MQNPGYATAAEYINIRATLAVCICAHMSDARYSSWYD